VSAESSQCERALFDMAAVAAFKNPRRARWRAVPKTRLRPLMSVSDEEQMMAVRCPDASPYRKLLVAAAGYFARRASMHGKGDHSASH